MDISDLFKVKIVFAQSHLFFPHIINWLLVIMFILVLVIQVPAFVRDMRAGRKSLPFTNGLFDAKRLLGTLALTIAYFIGMPYVGDYFPNEGLGFLFMSIPYMAALSLLYLHQYDRGKLLRVGLNSIVAPLVAWYVLAHLFAITLP
jgi:hypothetical protein